MSDELTFQVHIMKKRRGAIELREGAAPPPPPPPARVPARIARLVAVAHRVESLVRNGEVADYADVAQAAGITRARVSQLINLLLLAPDIQEQLLFMVRPARGCDAIGEQHVRSIVLEPDWAKQRRMFAELTARKHATH